ncbi:NADH-quinone oxidoreductase subunit N [Streptosporangium canum]|uniref:NADH-quinone oxidoreductase subunit N n=1 Tax=Streptosporangium canum TaxID=324952 RepID=UPI00379BA24F
MNGMNDDPLDLLPELFLLGGAVLGLLTGMFLPRHRQPIVAWICALALTGGLAAGAFTAARPGGMAFESYALDPLTHVTRATVMLATLLVVVLASGWARGHRRETEAYVLILLSALGAVILAGTADLLVFVAAYLLASIPAYALTGFAKDAPGTEAALKYYLMGAFLGVPMLAGVTLLYGLTGSTDYAALGGRLTGVPGAAVACALVALLAGVLFKIGGVPAHFWVPDVAEGAPAVVAAFVTTVPKVGAFVALFRMAGEFFTASAADWRLLLALVATATMTLGNLAAFFQDNVRRLLAYSTISQAGYLLLPVVAVGRSDLAAPALLFYLGAYAVTNLGAFAVVVATGRDSLGGYTGLARRSPGLAASLAVCLFGLIGTPPTAVFVGKLLAFAAAWDAGQAWLAVVAAANTVASVFYYLRWVVPVFRPGDPASPEGLGDPGSPEGLGDPEGPGDPGRPRRAEGPGDPGRPGGSAAGGVSRGAAWVAHVAAGASVLLGVASGLMLARGW